MIFGGPQSILPPLRQVITLLVSSSSSSFILLSYILLLICSFICLDEIMIFFGWGTVMNKQVNNQSNAVNDGYNMYDYAEAYPNGGSRSVPSLSLLTFLSPLLLLFTSSFSLSLPLFYS